MKPDSVNLIGTILVNIPWMLWTYFSFKFLYDIAQEGNLILTIAGAYIAGGITLYVFFYTFEVSNALQRMGYKLLGKKSKSKSR